MLEGEKMTARVWGSLSEDYPWSGVCTRWFLGPYSTQCRMSAESKFQ